MSHSLSAAGDPLAFGLPPVFTPEIALPPANNSVLYVFALPD